MWTIIAIDIHIRGEDHEGRTDDAGGGPGGGGGPSCPQLKTTRSAFARDALRDALAKHRVKELEQKHRLGYQKHPVKSGEFDVWQTEQRWGDE